MQPPIFITGCVRSGTSLTAGIVASCGTFGGITFGPSQYNLKEMYENKKAVKSFLRSINADSMRQRLLPPSLHREIRKIMTGEKYETGQVAL